MAVVNEGVDAVAVAVAVEIAMETTVNHGMGREGVVEEGVEEEVEEEPGAQAELDQAERAKAQEKEDGTGLDDQLQEELSRLGPRNAITCAAVETLACAAVV